MLVTIVRVSDQTHRVEYEPIEMGIDKKGIIAKFGRCESGEIIYVKAEGELKLELHYNSQFNEYHEYAGNLGERDKED